MAAIGAELLVLLAPRSGECCPYPAITRLQPKPLGRVGLRHFVASPLTSGE
jgi:hypothetical protein